MLISTSKTKRAKSSTKRSKKFKERLNKSSKPKLYRPICRFFIEPLLKLVNISEEKTQEFLELIKDGGKDFLKTAVEEKPIKLSKRSVEMEKKYAAEVDSLNQRIMRLEEDNQKLRDELCENSKSQDIEKDHVRCEKVKLEEIKSQLEESLLAEKKAKEEFESKMSNYRTRIFFLETQNEELENKKKSHIDMATNKLKNKNKNLEKEQKKLRKEKAAADDKVEGLRMKLEEFIGGEQSLRNKEKQHQETIDKLAEEIAKMERKLVELKTDYADRMYSIEIK